MVGGLLPPSTLHISLHGPWVDLPRRIAVSKRFEASCW